MADDILEIAEQEIAEDYWRQRQESVAQKSGFEAMGKDNFLKWMEDHEELLIKIAESNGSNGETAKEAVEQYKKTIREAKSTASFDDLNAYVILEGIIREIENICDNANVPIHGSVVFGSIPKLGLEASQMAVQTTRASIIAVSLPFLTFCNQVSKILTLSMPHNFDGKFYRASNDPSEVISNIKSNPFLLSQWAHILSTYAIFGWPPKGPILTVNRTEHVVTRILLLKALELFAVAHEYGHHALDHGVGGSGVEKKEEFVEEYEADAFARVISMNAGLNDEFQNFYAASGSGGVIILSVLDLIHRSKSLLLNGVEKYQPSQTHPPIKDRITNFAQLDQNAPEDYQQAFSDMRDCFVVIMEDLWNEMRPLFEKLHNDNIRPISDTPEPSDWLPLMR